MTKRIPANVRAVQLQEETRLRLTQLAGLPGSKKRKHALIDEILRCEGYTTDEIENRGPVELTKLFPL